MAKIEIPIKGKQKIEIILSQEQDKDLKDLISKAKKNPANKEYNAAVSLIRNLAEPVLSRKLSGLSEEAYEEKLKKDGKVPLKESLHDMLQPAVQAIVNSKLDKE